MALAFTNLGTLGDPTDATSYNVSVSAPASSCWLIVDVSTEVTSGNPNIPTLSGGSLTYSQDTTQLATVRRLTRFVAQVGTSPGAYTLTVDFAGQTELRCCCHVTQVTGGDAADITVQSLTVTGSSTSCTIDLGTFASTNNRALMATMKAQGSEVIDPAVGFTELADLNTTGETQRMETLYGNTGSDTIPSCTWTTSVARIGLASEIAAGVIAAGVSSTTVGDPFGMAGSFGG